MARGYVKTPCVLQMEIEECGAACLMMVLSCFGKHLPLERVRSDCGVNRDGSSAAAIVEAAERYGLVAKAKSCNLSYLKNEAQYPAILHWNFNHFVVLCGFKGSNAIINDPARGRVKVKPDELSSSFTGVMLEFEPGPTFKKEGKPENVLSLLKDRLKGLRTAAAYIMLASLATSAGTLMLPSLYRYFMDRLLISDDGGIAGFTLLFSLVIAYSVLAEAILDLFSYKLKGKMSLVASSKYLWHSIRLPMDFFSQRYSSDVANRLSENEEISSLITDCMAPFVSSVTLILISIALMCSYSPLMTLVAVLAAVLELLSVRLSSSVNRDYVNSTMVDKAKMRNNTVNGIEMIETIKALGAESGFFSRWAGIGAKLNEEKVKFSKRENAVSMVPAMITEAANLLILTLGISMIIAGRSTLGMFLSFQAYANGFMTPVKNVISSRLALDSMIGSLRRVDDVMRYPEDPALSGDGAELRKLDGHIEIKNVTFGYNRLEEPIFKDFSLDIKKGSTIAFVGLSGCGKSTLVKLISGLCQPWDGEILFDGKRRNEYKREVMTSSIGVVNQEICVFEDTLMENLKMWDRTIDNGAVIKACRDAEVHEEIMLRGGGYDCSVSQDGRNFSGGQLERLEIARTLAQKPTILILDEASNALDSNTERKIMRRIKARGITTIIVSHRLSAIVDTDEIIVFQRGEIVERGKHSELFAAGGLYSRLVTME